MSGLQRAPAHCGAGQRGKEAMKPARALEIDTAPQPTPGVLLGFSGLFIQIAELSGSIFVALRTRECSEAGITPCRGLLCLTRRGSLGVMHPQGDGEVID